jgi:hypothetical protein
MRYDFDIWQSKRGRIYDARMAAPRHFTQRLQRAEVSVSLRTDNLSKAKRSAREISSWALLLFEELREMPDISFEDIDERIRAYFQTCLKDGEEKAMLLPSDPMSDVAAEVANTGCKANKCPARTQLQSFVDPQRQLLQQCFCRDLLKIHQGGAFMAPHAGNLRRALYRNSRLQHGLVQFGLGSLQGHSSAL